jgi:membrane carboxypeptidase/penicillin-binding protein PbpC
MAEKGLITTDEFTNAIRQKLSLRNEQPDPISSAPAFTRLVVQQLDSSFGQHRLERGGLIIQTTLDASLQEQFTCAALTQLLVLENPTASGVAFESESCDAALLLPTQIFTGLDGQGLAAAGVIMDPKSGQVLAYLGPTRYNGDTRSDSGYQAGTLVSPFIARAGFTGGFSPSSLKWDTPVSSDPTLVVHNPDGIYHGPVSLRSSIVGDYLTPLVQLANQVDTTRVAKIATALGFSPINAPKPADMFSSQVTTSLLNVGAAYSTLANSGVRVGIASSNDQIEPNLLLRVVSTSNRLIVDRSQPATSAVLSEPLAYLINNVLSDTNTRRESYGYPSPIETGQAAAIKVGQTADKSQVWTVGYTPERLILTWMGLAEPGTAQLEPLVPAGLWNAMTKTATRDLPDSGWSMPSGVKQVEVCIPSGMLPSIDCPATREEVFLAGNEPVLADTLFEKVQINRETGQRATIFTSPLLIEESVVMNVPADLRQWALDNGYNVAPAGYDSIPYLAQDPNALLTAPAMFGVIGGKVQITGTAGGDAFAYYSIQIGKGINPDTWQQLGDPVTSAVNAGKLAEWDTSGLDGLYAIRLLVVNKSNEAHQAVLQVTVDNTPPAIQITTPLPDQKLQSIAGAVTLSASVQDSSPIVKVEWWIDGKLAGTQTNAPYAWQLKTTSGKHTVQVKAWDSAANTAQSPTIQFSINPQ